MSKQLPYKVLLNELVSISFNDSYLCSIDKWKSHTNQYLRDPTSMPHRAFSIFLFNSSNQLLFQRRSIDKKTFPLCWTNTCCSHPNMIQDEEKNKSVENIRDALHRALDRELKMDLTQQKFYLVDKILYKAYGKEDFGEYEVDYVFLCKINTQSVKYDIVKEEISEVEWVAHDQLKKWMDQKVQQGCYFSPWFDKMITNGLLEKWWQQVQSGNLINLQENKIKVKNYL